MTKRPPRAWTDQKIQEVATLVFDVYSNLDSIRYDSEGTHFYGPRAEEFDKKLGQACDLLDEILNAGKSKED